MPVEVKIPESGESITEVQIGEWTKSEGDSVKQDEPLVEIETDKASMELPAPTSGVLKKLMKQSGDEAKVGEVIALIEEQEESAETEQKPAEGDEGGKAEASTDKEDEKKGKGKPEKEADTRKRGETEKADKQRDREQAEAEGSRQSKGNGRQRRPEGHPQREQRDQPAGEKRVMPAARRALNEHGLHAEDVPATGPGGRLLKEDVQRYAESGARQPGAIQEAAESTSEGAREEEVVKMSMIRRRIAARLVESQQNTASLSTFNEVDMSAVMDFRKQFQDQFVQRYGFKLGFMSFFVKAAIDALKQQPVVNAMIREDSIVYRNYYDVGVAVSTDRGLMVPVIRNAERLSFAEIEETIGDFAQRAREKKIDPEELQGGTFTISNGGVFGSLLSTPILNPPQSAILGLHAIQERPVAIEGDVVIRPMMYVALSYDHRIIDGREAVTFLKRIKECIEDPARMLLEV